MMSGVGRVHHTSRTDTLDRNLLLIKKKIVNKKAQFDTTLVLREIPFQSGVPRDAGRLI